MSKTWKFMQRMEYLISPRNRNGVKTEIHLKYSPIRYSMLRRFYFEVMDMEELSYIIYIILNCYVNLSLEQYRLK